MKILFVNTNIGYGGASKMMTEVANSLSKNHQVTLLTFRNSHILQELSDRVVHIHNPLYSNKIKPLENIGQIFSLHKFIKKNHFDVAIAFLHPSNYMLTLAGWGTKTKVLLSERGDPVSRKKNGGIFVHLIERIMHCADAYVFQSEGAKAAYPKRCQIKGAVIPNSIEIREVSAPQDKDRENRIVHVARMELIQKRQDIMLKAFKIFSEKFPDYILEFYGDGPDEEKMKLLAKELKIQDKVRFLGAQKNICEKILNAKMFILTSDYEGIPNALLEAMAIGVPCISTDCSPGGARMIIDDGVNGFITPCGNVDVLADRMISVANDNSLGENFSQNSRQKLTEFEPKTVYDKWNKFIQNTAG